MIKSYAVPFVLFSIFASSCGQTKSPVHSESRLLPLYDTSKVAVLVYDFKMNWPFDSTHRSATLEQDDFKHLDSLIEVAINRYNSQLEPGTLKSVGIDTVQFSYKRQYLPVVNIKGEKLVWANFFCRSYNRNWKKELFVVDDGGNCYFNFIVNLYTAEVVKFFVNGYAYSATHNMVLAQAEACRLRP